MLANWNRNRLPATGTYRTCTGTQMLAHSFSFMCLVFFLVWSHAKIQYRNQLLSFLSHPTNSSHWPNAALPEAIKYLPIWLDPQHDVVCGGVMDEGTLGVDKEHVGDPNLLHQPAVKGHALVVGAGERQPLVFPVVPQIQRHGEVLQQKGLCHNLHFIGIAVISPLWDKPQAVKHHSWKHIHSLSCRGHNRLQLGYSPGQTDFLGSEIRDHPGGESTSEVQMLHFGVCEPLQGLKGRHVEAVVGGECCRLLNSLNHMMLHFWSHQWRSICCLRCPPRCSGNCLPPGSWKAVLQWELFLQHSHWNLFDSEFDPNGVFVLFLPTYFILRSESHSSLSSVVLESDPRGTYTWVCLFPYFKGSPHVSRDKFMHKCL